MLSVTTNPTQPSNQPYSPWNPRRPSKADGEGLGKIFDDHIEANYDLFTKKSDASFSTLGKYHVEMGTMPLKHWDVTSPLPAVDFDFNTLILPPPMTTVLHIDGEDLWSSSVEEEKNRFLEGLVAALDEHGKFFLEGAAGYGKSTYVKSLVKRLGLSDTEYVVLCPYGSLINKVWGGFRAMTDCKAFGQTVDEEGGLETKKKDKKRDRFDFGTLKLLVVDEAYLVQLENIYRIQRIMKTHPDLKVICLGCVWQNDCIVKMKPNVVHCSPISETLEKVFSRMFPQRVVLRINKRSPGDQLAYEEIHRMTFEEHLSPKEVIEKLDAKNLIGGIVSCEQQLMDMSITTHIPYTNGASMRLNKMVHCGIYKQPYKFELATDGIYFLKRPMTLGSGRKYPIGTRVRFAAVGEPAAEGGTAAEGEPAAAEGEPAAKGGFEQVAILNKDTNAVVGEDTIANGDKGDLQRVGVYVLRSYMIGLVRNCLVYLTELPTKENGKKYRFGQTADAKAGEGVTVRKEKVDFKSFRLPYAATGHSCQGTTIEGRYCIHDIGIAHMSPKWFWTAMTRGVSLKNIYIYLGQEQSETMLEKRSLEVAERKLARYVKSDKETGREEREYDVRKMASMARDAHGRRCQGRCGETCETVMDLFSDEGDAVSFDRIDNSRGHAVDNLRCTCVACSVHAQDRDDE